MSEIYSRPECIFNYCDAPDECKPQGACRHAATPVRSDVDNFSTLSEAIEEATIRSEGGDVWLHKVEYLGTHSDSETCGCEPVRINNP